jgi:hypothetical protein
MAQTPRRIDLLVKELSDEQLHKEIAGLEICYCKNTLCKYCAINGEIKLRRLKIKAERLWGKFCAERFFRK